MVIIGLFYALCLRKRANFGKLYLRQAWANFDNFQSTSSAHFQQVALLLQRGRAMLHVC